MIEQKLLKLTQDLPTPNSSWGDIILRNHKVNPTKPYHKLRPAAILLLLLLSLTLSVGAYRYGQIKREIQVIHSYSNLVMPTDDPWGKTQKLLKKLDVILPDTLMDTPFEHGRQFSVVPKGTPTLEAMFTEFYTPIDIHYSNVVFTDELGNFERTRYLSVNVGSTEQPYWKHYFEVSEDGSFYADASHVEYYKGIELRGKSRSVEEPEIPGEYFMIHSVQWVDKEKNLCFNVSLSRTDNLEFLMECAKQVIDLNH